jgi:hypothetical protein
MKQLYTKLPALVRALAVGLKPGDGDVAGAQASLPAVPQHRQVEVN